MAPSNENILSKSRAIYLFPQIGLGRLDWGVWLEGLATLASFPILPGPVMLLRLWSEDSLSSDLLLWWPACPSSIPLPANFWCLLCLLFLSLAFLKTWPALPPRELP